MEKLLICFINIYTPKWGENEFIIFGWRVLEKEKANRNSLISQYKSKKLRQNVKKSKWAKEWYKFLQHWETLVTLHG